MIEMDEEGLEGSVVVQDEVHPEDGDSHLVGEEGINRSMYCISAVFAS